MVAGQRFDLEQAREEARRAKQAARMKKIVSNCVLVAVLIAVLIGGKAGWDMWQEKKEREALEAQRLEEMEAAKAAQEKKAQQAAQKEREAKRERDRKEAEERRRADIKAREEARIAAQRQREEARAAELRRREEERQARLREADDRRAVQSVMRELKFELEDHIVFEAGTERCATLKVDDKRWEDLASMARSNSAIEFFDMLRGENVTNRFSELDYPDRSTVSALLDNLDKERFTMVVTLDPKESKDEELVLVAPDSTSGLALPDGARAMREGKNQIVGWTVPFVYGSKEPVMLLTARRVHAFNREWNELVKKTRRAAASLSNRDEYVGSRLSAALPDFIRSLMVEIKTPLPTAEELRKREEELAKEQEKAKADKKKANSLSGGLSNDRFRTMNGPANQRNSYRR